MGGAATQSTSVRIPPPGAAYARGAPSAEEAAPCMSRLRPPLPATTPPAQTGPRCLPRRAPVCRHTRTVPPGETPGLLLRARAPPQRAARTGIRLGLRNDPGPQAGRPVRIGFLAGRATRGSLPFARTTLGAVHLSRPSPATLRPGRHARINPHPGRPTRPGPPTHAQVGNAHSRHPRARAGPCPHPHVGHPARPPSRPPEQLHRPEPKRCRRPAGPSNCRPRTPP